MSLHPPSSKGPDEITDRRRRLALHLGTLLALTMLEGRDTPAATSTVVGGSDAGPPAEAPPPPADGS